MKGKMSLASVVWISQLVGTVAWGAAVPSGDCWGDVGREAAEDEGGIGISCMIVD